METEVVVTSLSAISRTFLPSEVKIESVTSTERVQAFQVTEDKVIVTFVDELPPNKEASVTITYDRYGHLMPGNEAEAAELLDGYLIRADTEARLAQL